MKANTRLFGEIEVSEDKIITVEQGIIGFPEMKRFTLIFDVEKEGKDTIMWLQSLDDGCFAMPVMNPKIAVSDYTPNVDDELLKPLGKLKDEDVYILTTVTIPQGKVEEITINLKAPVIINLANNKGCQLIVEDDYPVKHKIYDILKNRNEKAGE